MLKRWFVVACIAASFPLYPSTQAQQANASARGLVGSWTLIGAERVEGSAPVSVSNPRGLIIFDSAGHAVEVVTRSGRKPYAANQPTPEEALEAFNTFGGFWGSYRPDEKAKIITYHPEGAVNPNLMGQDLIRTYELAGDRLVITSQPGESNVRGTTRWTWQRVPPIENLSAAYRKLMGFWQWVGEKSVATATGQTMTEGKRDPSIIVYAPSGYIAVHFVPDNRRRLAGPMATAEEAKADIARYVGYIAVLTLHPGHVVHHQLYTIAPGGGGSLDRSYELVENEVHLNFPPAMVQGQERQTRVTLRRLSGEAEMLGK